MARAYSTDLRERAVSYIHEGGSRKDAVRIFKISYRTLSAWLRQLKEEGTLSPKPKGSRPWKLDHEAVVDYVKEHNDSTLEEIASHFDTHVSVIDYILKKYKVTRKKNDALRGTKRRRKTSIPVRDQDA
jgi:transposase